MLAYRLIAGYQVALMFLEMLLGILLFRRGMIDEAFTKKLSNFLLSITTPAAIFASYQRPFDPETGVALLESFILAAAFSALLIIGTKLLFPKKRFPDAQAQSLCVIFTNCGAIGIPLLTALVGSTGVFLGSSLMVIISILQWTYGVLTITQDSRYISIKKTLLNPGTICFYLGVALFLSPVKLPPLLFDAVNAIGSMNTPLGMLILGSYIAQTNFKSCLEDRRIYVALSFRLLIIPVIILGLLTLAPVDLAVKMALMIGFASPCSMGIPMFAQMFGGDYLFPSKCVVLSTLLSIVTLPVTLSIANALWTL